MKFPIGTRVSYDFSYYVMGRRTGTVMDNNCGVRFDQPDMMFHDLGGLCEMGHGFWCPPDLLEPIKSLKIEDDPEYSDLFI